MYELKVLAKAVLWEKVRPGTLLQKFQNISKIEYSAYNYCDSLCNRQRTGHRIGIGTAKGVLVLSGC